MIATDLDADAIATLIVAIPVGLAAIVPRLSVKRRREIARAYTMMLRAVLDPDLAAPA